MLKLRRWMRQRELLRLLDKPRYAKGVDRKLADTFFTKKAAWLLLKLGTLLISLDDRCDLFLGRIHIDGAVMLHGDGARRGSRYFLQLTYRTVIDRNAARITPL